MESLSTTLVEVKPLVHELLEKGANIEAIYNDGWTYLHLASRKGHIEMVIFLLEKGANLESTDNLGRTPLHWASVKGHLEIVQLMV